MGWDVRTYRTLDPGPYWPDTGQAQTTWSGSPVLLTACDTLEVFEGASRWTKTPSRSAGEMAGMALLLLSPRWQRQEDGGLEALRAGPTAVAREAYSGFSVASSARTGTRYGGE